MRKGIRVLGLSLMMSLVFGAIVYGAEGQSARWIENEGKWQVSDGQGGVIRDCWFQDDVSGYKYLLGTEGEMYVGLVTDNSTGYTYLLNPNHDGTYGKLITVDGTYNINNKQVNLSFNQEQGATFGAIISGLEELRGTGISEISKESIGVDGNAGVNNTQTAQSQDINNPVHGQIRQTRSGVYQWDANLNMWLCVSMEMTKLDEKSATWSDTSAEIGKQIAENAY